MKDRVKYLDGLRFFAIMNVILIHVFGLFRHQYFSTNNLKYTLVTFADSFTRTGVPLFFMLTGILMFTKKDKNEGYITFFRKRVLKFILIYLFFSMIYYIYSHLGYKISLYNFFATITSNQATYHLWFMPVIILIYLFIPFLKKFISNVTRKDLETIIIIIFIFGNVFNAISKVSMIFGRELLGNFSLPNLLIYINYLFLGYYLYKYEIKIKKIKIILSIISIILMPIFSVLISKNTINDLFLGATSPLVIMPTIVIFLLFKKYYNKIQIPSVINTFISKNSANIIYVYLWHVLIIEILNKWLLKYRINQPFIEDIIWMIIYYIVAVILSFTISIVWNKIVLLLKKILKSFPAIIINKKC